MLMKEKKTKMRKETGGPQKAGFMCRLAAGSVAALFLLTAVPSVVFSVRPRESGSETAARFSEEEIKMASDISNDRGKG